MTFAELPVGAKFRLFRRGAVRTKTSEGGYTTPGAKEQKMSSDIEVLPEDDDPPLAPTAPQKADDVAVLTKALDDLEALQGKKAGPQAKSGLAAARQALRRLAALARLKVLG